MKKTSLILLLAFSSIISLPVLAKKSDKYFLFIGTYTKTQQKGIFVYEFDTNNGSLTPVSHTENISNPSFLTINKKGDKVFSVSENFEGGVYAFDFDKKSGKLTLINEEKVKGQHPCYITLTKDEKNLVVANYSSGSISIFPIKENGEIGKLSQQIQHEGKSIKPEQKSAHAHSVVNSTDGQKIYSADLGSDKIFVYDYKNNSKQPLNSNTQQAFISTQAGTGPRHFTFNKKGNKVYLVGELNGHVIVYDHTSNGLKEIQSINMNNKDFKGVNGGADIHLSQDDNFLYVSNRGSVDEIVIFKVDHKTGKLTKIGVQKTLGVHPRNFAIDPTDSFLLVANQNTDNIIVFKRDKQTGLLEKTGQELKIGAPVYLNFVSTN